jgi:hypothetical protein
LQVLAQLEALLLSQLDKVLATLVQQSAVGGIGNRLGHDGGVDNDPIQARLFDQPGRTGRFKGDRQQGFHAFLANALSPARQAGRINGQLGLQIDLATKVLPVGIFQPGGHNGFIGGVVGMLQIQQPGDESGRQCGPPPWGDEMDREAAFDLAPVHQGRQAHQGGLQVDLPIQTGTEQIG